MRILIHLLQEFQPIVPFYPSVLIDNKKFTSAEIAKSILPFFFYASLITIFICFPIVEVMGHSVSLVVAAAFQSSVLLILLNMPERSFIAGQLLYGLGGSSSALKSILRVLLVPIGANAVRETSNMAIWRCLTQSTSAWIGQGIYNISYNHNINIVLSLLFIVVSGVFSGIESLSAKHELNQAIKDALSSPAVFLRLLRDSLSGTVVPSCLCAVSVSTLKLYLSIFSATLFRDKTTKEQGSSGIVFRILNEPIMVLSRIIVSVFARISAMFAVNEKQSKPINIGYIEGTIKLMAAVTAKLLCFLAAGRYEIALLPVFGLMALSSFVVLSLSKSVIVSKLFYFTTLTLLTFTQACAVPFLYIDKNNKTILSTFILFSEIALHSSVNGVSRLLGLRSQSKSMFYAFCAACMLSLSLYLVVRGTI